MDSKLIGNSFPYFGRKSNPIIHDNIKSFTKIIQNTMN